VKIGVDFDRVLFKTDKFNEYLKEAVEGLEHVDTPPYNEHEVYSPEIHAEMCGIGVEDIYSAIKDLERFLYEDVEILDEFEDEIVIVTRGEKRFQKAKVQASGVDEHVDDVIIVEKGSKDVADIDFLIDDQRREIEKAELPGFELVRSKNKLKNAIEEARNHEA
jgi:hypothetical protein